MGDWELSSHLPTETSAILSQGEGGTAWLQSDGGETRFPDENRRSWELLCLCEKRRGWERLDLCPEALGLVLDTQRTVT